MNGALFARPLTCHSECLLDLEPGTGCQSLDTGRREYRRFAYPAARAESGTGRFFPASSTATKVKVASVT